MKPKGKPTPRRKFTDNFSLGDEVFIIRTEHGWFDGNRSGKITRITDYGCTVTDTEGIPHDIPKPRDIHKKEPWQ